MTKDEIQKVRDALAGCIPFSEPAPKYEALAILDAALAAPEQEPDPSVYNLKRIGWELERTAMGDGYYGNALYAAKEIPGLTSKDRSLLDRYMTGGEMKTDHVALQDLAMRIYKMEPPAPQLEQEPVAWGMPSVGSGLIVDVISPEEHFREEGGYTVPLYRHPVPQSAQPVADRTAWLVELVAGPFAPAWLSAATVENGWTKDANAAISFPSKEAAIDVFERLMTTPRWRSLGFGRDCYKITEHMFIHATQPCLPDAQSAQPTDCTRIMREQGKPYPRTCPRCKLGPCAYSPAVEVTAPPSREWQELSPLEMRDTLRNCAASTFDKLAPNWYEVRQFARAIESALRAKNTGEQT